MRCDKIFHGTGFFTKPSVAIEIATHAAFDPRVFLNFPAEVIAPRRITGFYRSDLIDSLGDALPGFGGRLFR